MNKIARRLLRQGTAILALTLTALACLPAALGKIAPDSALTLLLPIMLIGASAGFILFGSRFRGTRPAWLFVCAGTAIIFIRVAEAGTAVSNSLLETLRLAVTLVLPGQGAVGNLEETLRWVKSWSDIWAQVLSFTQRAAVWVPAALHGQPGADPAARTLYLALGVWMLACWTSWRIRSKHDPLGGLLPITLLLALTLDLTGQDRWPLWLNLAALMSLLSVTNLVRLLRRWNATHIDYSDSVAEDSLLSATILIVLVMTAAFTASSFSIKDMLDRWREQQRPRPASVGASSPHAQGAAPGILQSGAGETLQDTHPITAGPKLSQDLVMYIGTGDLPPRQQPAVKLQVPHYYWRAATYQTYTGRGWNNPTRVDRQIPAKLRLVVQIPGGYRPIHGLVSFPASLNGIAYWPGVLIDIDTPLEVAWHTASVGGSPKDTDVIGAMIASAGQTSRQSYTFEALVPEINETALKAAPAMYPDWVSQRYLQLPDSVPERVRALARDITARGATPYERAVAIEAYLRRIPYSLKVPAPPSDRDAVDYFLFDLKRGYCDYYATAMTVLARSAGLPARLVTGYAAGSYDPYTAQYVVTKADAHAWPEIYFTGIGWIEFEPTANEPAPSRESLQRQIGSDVERPSANQTSNILPGLDLRPLKALWWVFPVAAALYAFSLVYDMLRLRRMHPDELARHVYQRLRKSTRHIVGETSPSQTALERARSVQVSLAGFGSSNRVLRSLLVGASRAVDELSDLYMQSLFAPIALSERDSQTALSTWVALRWRLALLSLLLIVRRRSPTDPGAPSNGPGHPAA